MSIRDKIVGLCAAIDDSKCTFVKSESQILSAVEITDDIIAYIKEKCGNDGIYHESRIYEMSRDCRIYVSRLNRLKNTLNDLNVLCGNICVTLFQEETPENLKKVFDDLLETYLSWYERYNDFKLAFSRAKTKWYGFETSILSTVN